MRTRVFVIVGAALLLAACGQEPDPTWSNPAAESFDATISFPPERSEGPTPAPSLGPDDVVLGEPIPIERDGVTVAEVTVTEALEEMTFPNPTGPGGDRPTRSTDVFEAVRVSLTAVQGNFALDPTAFRLTVDGGDPIPQSYSDLSPQPELLATTVVAGTPTLGWILYEVPETGRIELAYDDGSGTASTGSAVLRGP